MVNCAGPFARFGEPVLRAAIAAGAHYLDTTGEQLWMARMMDLLGADAERRGVTAILAHAFEYAVGDCAARIAVEETPGAETVEVVNRVQGFGDQRGTQEVRARRAHQARPRRRERAPPREVADSRTARTCDSRTRTKMCVALSYGGGEVLSAPSFAPTVRTVRTYLVVPGGVALLAPLFARGATPLLGAARAASSSKRASTRRRSGPGEERRDAALVGARARARRGRPGHARHRERLRRATASPP